MSDILTLCFVPHRVGTRAVQYIASNPNCKRLLWKTRTSLNFNLQRLLPLRSEERVLKHSLFNASEVWRPFKVLFANEASPRIEEIPPHNCFCNAIWKSLETQFFVRMKSLKRRVLSHHVLLRKEDAVVSSQTPFKKRLKPHCSASKCSNS